MKGSGAEKGQRPPFQDPENTVWLWPECVQARMGGQAFPTLRSKGRFGSEVRATIITELQPAPIWVQV